MKTVSIADFLTTDQIKTAIWLAQGGAKAICKHLIEPNLEEINLKLGQENDPMYLAYAVEHAIQTASKEEGI